MLSITGLLFKMLGLNIRISDRSDRELDIEMGIDGVNVFDNSNLQNEMSKCAKGFIYTYRVLIWLIISWSIGFSVLYAITSHNINYFLRSIFQMIFSSHYILLIRYYSYHIDHYYKKIHEYQNLKFIFNVVLIIGMIVVLIFTVIFVISMTLLNTQHVYGALYSASTISGKILLIIISLLDAFYSYTTFLISSCTFCLIMLSHKSNVLTYTEKIVDYDDTTSPRIKMNNIVREYPELRDDFSDTVTKMNKFFVTLNIFGIIGLYIVVKSLIDNTYNYIDLINGLLFICVDYIYISTIQKVRTSVKNILNAIVSSQVIHNMLRKKDHIMPSLQGDMNIEKIGDAVNQNLKTLVTMEESVEWLMILGIISQKWETFTLFGANIDDTGIIQKVFAIFIGLLISQNIANLINL